jgi:hypothetical protein
MWKLDLMWSLELTWSLVLMWNLVLMWMWMLELMMWTLGPQSRLEWVKQRVLIHHSEQHTHR